MSSMMQLDPGLSTMALIALEIKHQGSQRNCLTTIYIQAPEPPKQELEHKARSGMIRARGIGRFSGLFIIEW